MPSVLDSVAVRTRIRRKRVMRENLRATAKRARNGEPIEGQGGRAARTQMYARRVDYNKHEHVLYVPLSDETTNANERE